MTRAAGKDLLAIAVPGIGLLFVLHRAYGVIDRWAANAFAQPFLGAMLVGVVQLALFFAAVCLASGLSHFLRRLLR